MTETREFPTAAVLSAITGMLIVPNIGPVYEVLNFMTGESLMTHQLPRVGREATAVMLKRHPELAQTLVERDQVNPSNWQLWRDRWVERHGPTMAVPRMTAADHERIDPLSEAAELIHPDRIVVVKT